MLVIMLCAVVSCDGGKKESGQSQNVSDADIAVSSGEPEEAAPSVVSLSDVSMELGYGITRRIAASGGDQLEWKSSDDQVASVDSSGNVKGAGLGECVITVRNEYGNSAECAVTVKKTCYLTFDDGPTGYADNLLDALKETDVKATFFLVETPFFPIVERMAAEGHVLGLHTRRFHTYKDEFYYFVNLDLMNDDLEEYTGRRADMLRFPGGSNNTFTDDRNMRRVINGAHDLGYRVFDWTMSVGDASSGASYERSCTMLYSKCVHNQEIVLMHDKSFTPSVIRRMVPVLRERGYVFETLDHYPEDSYEFTPRFNRNHQQDIPSESVVMNKQETELEIGAEYTLKAILTPDLSTDFVVWQSSDEKVVTIDKGGKITGVAEGEAVITVRTTSGKTASCKVKVVSGQESR